MEEWLAEKELKRSQIVSITMNETEIEEGDNMLTIFYRENPVAADAEVPLVLKHTHFKRSDPWDKLMTEADKQRNCDIISFTHSAKNIGSCHNQFMFFVKGSNENGTPVFKLLKRDDGNWIDLVNEVRDWCNKYIPPHALISISLYEDEHPNEGKGINACITHTAGKDPQPLGDDIMKEAAGNIYDLQIISGSGEWEAMFDEAKGKINGKGGQEGHLVASCNDSSNDGGVVIVLSWGYLFQDNMKELTRPSGCMEQCTIF